MKTLENKTVYILVTGAKKCFIVLGLIKEFIGEGAGVYTFFTEMAKKMINMKDFEIRGNNISLDYSKNGDELPLEDIVLIVPSTFNTLNKIAEGIADNYPLTVVASSIGKRKKVIFAPAMNRSLWEHPIVPKSLETLQQWGCQIVWPEITPDKVTMAPLEKIADTTYNCFLKIRYESERLPIDENYLRAVGEHFSEFRSVGESLLENDLVKGSAGFMSKKIKEGILVSATGSSVGSLTKNDVSLVINSDDKKIKWKGEKHPSSEMPIISEIYKTLPEAKAIIHTHSRKLTYSPTMQKYISSEYLRYGKFGELNKIIDIIKKNEGFGIMKLHGELCIGDNLYNTFQKLKEKIENVKKE